MGAVALFLIGVLFILGGVLAFRYLIRARNEAQRSQSWPKTLATITQSNIRKSSSSADPRYGSSTAYSPDVVYTYQVAGTTYTGRRLSAIDHSSSSRDEAQSILNYYPVGGTVKVAYDPDAPTRALLLPGELTGTGTAVGLGTVLVVIGIALIIGACIMI